METKSKEGYHLNSVETRRGTTCLSVCRIPGATNEFETRVTWNFLAFGGHSQFDLAWRPGLENGILFTKWHSLWRTPFIAKEPHSQWKEDMTTQNDDASGHLLWICSFSTDLHCSNHVERSREGKVDKSKVVQNTIRNITFGLDLVKHKDDNKVVICLFSSKQNRAHFECQKKISASFFLLFRAQSWYKNENRGIEK